MVQKSRRWCFTLNNYTAEESEAIAKQLGVRDRVRYAIVGCEVGESGTPHLQGYISFKNPIWLGSVKTFLECERVHLEKANGNEESNFKYCSKDGNFKEFGERSKQGKRNDLESIKEALDNGASYDSLWDSDFRPWSGIASLSPNMLTLSPPHGESILELRYIGGQLAPASPTEPLTTMWSQLGYTPEEAGSTGTWDIESLSSTNLMDPIFPLDYGSDFATDTL